MHIPTAAPVPSKPLPLYRQLYFQVIVAIVLGAVLGHYEPLIGEKMKPSNDGPMLLTSRYTRGSKFPTTSRP